MATLPIRLQKNFNRISRVYQPLKFIFMANRPEKVISQAIRQFPFHSKWLIVGGGADNCLIELLQHNRAHEIVHIDISKELSIKANARWQKKFPETNVHFEVSPFLEFTTSPVDAILFPYYLDLFEDSEITDNLRHAFRLLAPNGKIYIIDFQRGKPSSWWQRMRTWGLYLLFWPITRVMRTDFPDFVKIVTSMGGKITRESEYFGKFYAVWYITPNRKE